jgi:tetratricopeptide (TPR) repeat protein
LAALAALVPILNLFPTYPPVADRYAQIPLLFMLCFFVVPVMVRLSRAIGLGVVATLLFVMGGLSFQQVNVWRNNETLFSHAVDVDSRALTSLQNLAHLRWWRGSEDLALENFKQLSESRPDDGEFELFSGWYAIHQKNFSEAEAQLRVAEGMNTKPYFVHMAFGDLYAAQGRVRLARERYERSRQDAEMRLQRDARAGMTLRLLEQRRARVR